MPIVPIGCRTVSLPFAGALLLACLIPCDNLCSQVGGTTHLRVERLPVDVELTNIRWVARLQGGALVFADAGTNLVYLRDARGVTSQLGRQGDGPGEYRAPENGFIKGDSVLMHAPGLARRTSIHVRDGRGETATLTPIGGPRGCRVFLLLEHTGLCEEPRISRPGDLASI